MENVDKRVAGSLTRFYVVALAVVAFLTIGGLFLVRKTIKSLNYDGRVVNVAGRQRMLSQRLTKLSILESQGITHSDSADFDSLLNLWKESHRELASRRLVVDNDVVTWKSPVLDQMFLRLNPVFEKMYKGFLSVQKSTSTPGEKTRALRTILANEPVFLAKMDEIVFQFDRESFSRLKNLETIEWIIDVMTILVLLAEGLLIFRPVVNTTRRAIRLLTESEKALIKANSDLEISNDQLLIAQQDIRRMEEEKYGLQLAEDRIRASALIEGQEEERRRFARELHDGIGQMLTGLKLHAEKLRQVQFADEKQRLRFDQLVRQIQDTIQTTRQISYNLMPSVLEDFGLNAALNLLCEQTRESSELNVKFEGDPGKAEISQFVAIGLYRIAQEALNNAVKHADAENITISLHRENDEIVLGITDDGKGFSVSDDEGRQNYRLNSSGIENIRTRTGLMNGELGIDSVKNGGTRILIKIDI
jgi:signal transduction histidine kinase